MSSLVCVVMLSVAGLTFFMAFRFCGWITMSERQVVDVWNYE